MSAFHIGNLVFELTESCNQCCRFCYNYWRDGSSPLAPPQPSLVRKTLRKLLSQTTIGTISFSGGEPMLLKNVHDLALFARFKGSHVNILTNGTLLTEDALQNFLHIGVSALQIPLLCADPQIHESLTNLPGSWQKASDALRRVAAALPRGAYAVLVISARNLEGVPQTLELIHSLGVRNVMVNRFNIGGMGLRNAGELNLDKAGLNRAFSLVESFAAAHQDMHFVSGVCTPLCLVVPQQYPHIRFTWCSTDFNKRPVTVNYKGDVRFCNHSPYVMGNIYDRPLGDILADPANIARYAQVPEHCTDCPLLNRCNGGCRAASEQLFGRFDLADPVLQTRA